MMAKRNQTNTHAETSQPNGYTVSRMCALSGYQYKVYIIRSFRIELRTENALIIVYCFCVFLCLSPFYQKRSIEISRVFTIGAGIFNESFRLNEQKHRRNKMKYIRSIYYPFVILNICQFLPRINKAGNKVKKNKKEKKTVTATPTTPQ